MLLNSEIRRICMGNIPDNNKCMKLPIKSSFELTCVVYTVPFHVFYGVSLRPSANFFPHTNPYNFAVTQQLT